MRALSHEVSTSSKCSGRPLGAPARRLARHTPHHSSRSARQHQGQGPAGPLRVAQIARAEVQAEPTARSQQPSASDASAAASLLQEIVAPVAGDMEQMNRNLRTVVGSRHPMLVAAADQIFGAGGKKLRPMVVFLVARATAELGGLR